MVETFFSLFTYIQKQSTQYTTIPPPVKQNSLQISYAAPAGLPESKQESR